jgi:hypothetical protein
VPADVDDDPAPEPPEGCEPPEAEPPKNARELWYPALVPPEPLRHAGVAGSSGAPPSVRRHVSLGIIE